MPFDHPPRIPPMLRASIVLLTSTLGLAVARGPVSAQGPAALGDTLALTPPMGWNSWNRFGCDVSSQLVRETADAMVESGMRDAGYKYVVIDDCWQVARDDDGRLVADSARFPEGMKALADYVHGRGLSFGLYTDAGRRTCQGRPGSYGHEDIDARTFAEWGVDYTKVDWCNSEGLDAPTQYGAVRDALAKAGRPIVFSICEWGRHEPWNWGGETGHLWRTTGDIQDAWWSVRTIVTLSSPYWTFAGPGHWNDPDMLEVGNGGMTLDEYRAHFSLWAIMAAPLMAGNDVRELTADTRYARAIRSILTNEEVIAVDQDSLGVQGRVVQANPPDTQVWAKPLADGSTAVLLLNLAPVSTEVWVGWDRIYLGSRSARVRDLWTHEDLGVIQDRYQTIVPSHGVAMIKVTPVSG